MNLGNNKSSKPKSKSIDDFVERLNKGFGRLLGKKQQSPIPSPETNNTVFSIIILLSCIMLWFSTGFYFLAENEYGLIFANGKIVDVEHGIKVGFTRPYPLGNIEIIDGAPSQTITIGASVANPFIVLDKNLLQVAVTAKFVYQITDPKKLYQNHLQDMDKLDNEIVSQVQSRIKNIIATRDITELKTANLTVFSNEIAGGLDSTLASDGITLNKFTLIKIHELTVGVDRESNGIIQLKEMDKQPLGERDFTRDIKRDRNWMDN